MLSLEKNHASNALDLLRAASAQVVCVGHAWSFFISGPKIAFQSIAVCVFFILSGFVITHTLLRRHREGFGAYLIARVARIYSVLLPSLIVVALVDVSLVLYGLHENPGYVTPVIWLKTLLSFNNYTGFGSEFLQAPSFGSGGPLWTLALEIHIYMFIGAVFFMVSRPRQYFWLLPVAVFFSQMPMAFLTGTPIGIGSGLFAIWLGGAAICAVLPQVIGPRIRRVFALMGLLAFIAYCNLIEPGREYDVALYPFLLASFAGIVVFAAGFETRSEGRFIRTIRFSANYSFTLYLVHYTILYAFSRIGLTGWSGFFGGVITANLIAIAMAIPTEMRHRAFARWLSALFKRKSLWPG